MRTLLFGLAVIACCIAGAIYAWAPVGLGMLMGGN